MEIEKNYRRTCEASPIYCASPNIWANEDEAEAITTDHVHKSIKQQIYRSDRIRERVHEEIRRKTLLVDTSGEKVGQVNGLSVISLGNLSFGRPSRITATARLGRGKVVDIEREVELGGSIHFERRVDFVVVACRALRDGPSTLAFGQSGFRTIVRNDRWR